MTAPEEKLVPPAEASAPALSETDLERVRARDPQALGALFEAYFDRLYAWAHRLLGERSAAEDVTQEVFLRVYRGAPGLDVTRDPWPWLVSITVNTCRDWWRSSSRRLERASVSLDGDPELPRDLPSADRGPSGDVEADERARLVQEAIEDLPEAQRTAVLLRDWGGLTHEAIAEVVGTTPVAARKCYSRALAALGKALEGRIA